ncbi:MAG: hypothetical protein DRQ24_05785 [Candidatus Latescibacterota bacterium]|nr:MAG: hypothetical protein DRQ24_05785 [Candidatus Latescibacterota bacterium]
MRALEQKGHLLLFWVESALPVASTMWQWFVSFVYTTIPRLLLIALLISCMRAWWHQQARLETAEKRGWSQKGLEHYAGFLRR